MLLRLAALPLAFLFSACTHLAPTADIPATNLVGTWAGQYTKKDGTIKSWKQIRHEDGTFDISFHYKHPVGGNSKSKDQGKWWLNDGQFYELNTEWATQAFVYQIEFYTSDCIKFTQISADAAGSEQENYQFSECRSTQD